MTKFSKVSVLSDLNNLEDISLQSDYQALCGVTHNKLTTLLADEIRELANANGMTEDEAKNELKEWYDGYHFTANGIGIYNPFSLLQVMKQKAFGNYWFETDTPYELVRDLELHYQNVMFIVFKLLGFYTQAEYHTSKGRIDLLVKTDKYIYIMAFKLDGTAEQALQQINEKNYSAPFASDGRTIIKIGANFSNESRSLEKWIVE